MFQKYMKTSYFFSLLSISLGVFPPTVVLGDEGKSKIASAILRSIVLANKCDTFYLNQESVDKSLTAKGLTQSEIVNHIVNDEFNSIANMEYFIGAQTSSEKYENACNDYRYNLLVQGFTFVKLVGPAG